MLIIVSQGGCSVPWSTQIAFCLCVRVCVFSHVISIQCIRTPPDVGESYNFVYFVMRNMCVFRITKNDRNVTRSDLVRHHMQTSGFPMNNMQQNLFYFLENMLVFIYFILTVVALHVLVFISQENLGDLVSQCSLLHQHSLPESAGDSHLAAWRDELNSAELVQIFFFPFSQILTYSKVSEVKA